VTVTDPTGTTDLRLSRQVYRLRILGLVLGCIAVGTVLRQQQAGWPVWAVLGFDVLVWPHLAMFGARRSRNPHRFERDALTIDSAFGGLWVALMHFNLLPSVLIVAMMSMDKIGWGPAFLARTSAAMAAAMACGALLTHGAFEPATNTP
jgi:diguanylate cyclase